MSTSKQTTFSLETGVFSMEVEVPRLLSTEIAWAVMGPKRNRLKQMYYLFKQKLEKNVPR